MMDNVRYWIIEDEQEGEPPMATIFQPQYYQSDDDELERRRRLLEENERARRMAEALASRPDANLIGAAPPPELPATRPRQVASADTTGSAGINTDIDRAQRQSRGRYADPIKQSRYDYLNAGADESGNIPRSLGGTLKSAGLGMLSGFARGGVAGGLGGAAGGAAGALINPRGAREQQFETFQRPRLEESEALRRYKEDRERKLAGERLDARYKEAQIGKLGVETLETQEKTRQSMIPKPPARITPNYRIVDVNGKPEWRDLNQPENQGKAPFFKPPEPKSYAPHWIDDVEGRQYNLNDPAERKRWDSLPRSKRVKPRAASGQFTSEAKEKTLAATKARAATDIEQLEAMARKTIEADESQRGPMLNEMRARVNNMKAQYGDSIIETGESGGWPFARLRAQQSTQKTAAPGASSSKSPVSAKSVSADQVRKFAEKQGISYAEAHAAATREGFTIK
jgi:hypothetical protein